MKLQAFFIFILFTVTFSTQGQPGRVLGLESVQKVEAEAEYLLKDSESKEDGFKKATELAEIEALRKIGQYAESIVFTDEATGESKEFFTTVSASLMSVEVLESTLDLSGTDLIARVKILAQYSEADARSALERYFENIDLRASLNEANSSLADAKASNVSQREEIAKLKDLQEELESTAKFQVDLNSELKDRIEKLKNILYKKQDNVSKNYSSLLSAVKAIDVSKEVYSASKLSAIYKDEIEGLPEAEKDYVHSLIKLVNGIEDNSVVTYPIDVKANKVTFYPVMRWSIAEKHVNEFLSQERDRLTKKTSNEDGLEVVKVNIDQTSYGLARSAYYVFYEVEVGDTVLKMPLLAPVKYKRRSANAFDTCVYGTIEPNTSLGKSLCLTTKMTTYGYVKQSAINAFDHQEVFTNKPSFTVSESIEVTIRIVIYKSDFTEVYTKLMRE